jgi:hypothetical protein
MQYKILKKLNIQSALRKEKKILQNNGSLVAIWLDLSHKALEIEGIASTSLPG